jgi:hypothetical protein
MRSGGAVDLGGVQKTLGHSSPEITAGIYDHSELEGHREAIERALTFNTPRPTPEPKPSSTATCGHSLATAHTVISGAPGGIRDGAPVGRSGLENEEAADPPVRNPLESAAFVGRGDRIRTCSEHKT